MSNPFLSHFPHTSTIKQPIKTKQEWKIGDCLELLPEIPDKSVDMILTDLPYGTTQNNWDSLIDFSSLWNQYLRIIKDAGSMVFTGQSLFTAKLIMSKPDLYRYSLIWQKTKAGGFLNANRMPLQSHEDIVVFYKHLPVYNPLMKNGKMYTKVAITNGDGKNYGNFERIGEININKGFRYPTSIIKVSNDNHNSFHPTQKPVELFEYLIKTYTNEGDMVHDSCLGSGTTLEACMNLNRNCIGFEIDPQWEPIYRKRLKLDNTRLEDFNGK